MKKILLILFLFVTSFASAQYDQTFNSGYGIKWNAGSYYKSTSGTLYLKGVELNFRNINDAIKFNVDDSGNVDITGEYRINGVSLIPIFKTYYDTVTSTLTNKSIDADSNTIANLTPSFMQITANTLNPADATTYYFGSIAAFSPETTPAVRRIYFPDDCTITAAYFSVRTAVAGTSENVTVSIRKNNTTDYDITTTSQWTGSFSYTTESNTAMNIPISAGDYIEVKIVCPTWSTNPTVARLSVTLSIE